MSLFLLMAFFGWVFGAAFMTTFCVWQIYRLIFERTKEYWFFLMLVFGAISAWGIAFRMFHEL